MRFLVSFLLILPALAEDAPSPEMLSQVGEYLATSDEARAKELEGLLSKVPIRQLERAIAEAPWGGGAAGDEEFEIRIPADGNTARVFVHLPAGYDASKLWPAVLTMHGTGERGPSQRARWAGYPVIVIAPEEQEKLQGKGWGSSEQERSLNLEALAQATKRFRIDPDRVFLAGVSRGGHATWEIGLLFADRFAALNPNAGGPRQVNWGYLGNLGKLPMLQTLGAHDQDKLVAAVREAVKTLTAAGCDITYHEDPDAGHGVGYADDVEFAKWMQSKRRDLFPSRVVHAFCRPGQGRAYWLEATKLAAGVVDPAEKPPAIAFKPGEEPSEEKKEEMFRKKVADGLARFEGTVTGGKIEIATRKVTEMTVYLSSRVVPLDAPVEIWVNGRKKFSGMVSPDPVKLLRHVRETGDRGRLFSASVKVTP